MLICIPGKVATVATVVTLRIFQRGGLFICVSFPLSFQSLVRIFHVFLPPLCPIFVCRFVFVHSDPRGPNFAKIHARGRRGRLEYDHRDLIPPWGHEHFFREEEKPTMPVCFDRNGGALPSRRTGMVGKSNDGCAGHGRDKANSLRSILRHIRST